MNIEEVSEICKAMSDANRLRIIKMLAAGEKCGCELLAELHITQPTLSHHMKVLADCGLVTSHKEGKWHHYSICCAKFRDFKNHLNSVTCINESEGQACCRNTPNGCGCIADAKDGCGCPK